jgi:hypothetical protein
MFSRILASLSPSNPYLRAAPTPPLETKLIPAFMTIITRPNHPLQKMYKVEAEIAMLEDPQDIISNPNRKTAWRGDVLNAEVQRDTRTSSITLKLMDEMGGKTETTFGGKV